jgi:hypothetical protein
MRARGQAGDISRGPVPPSRQGITLSSCPSRRIGACYIIQVFLPLLLQGWVSLAVGPDLGEPFTAGERTHRFD